MFKLGYRKKKNDYDNWLTCLESDNFSSFIKVWFAYLATIHEIVLKSCSKEEQDELLTKENGDGIFLDKFRNNHLDDIDILDSTKSIIRLCYDSSKQQIKEIHSRRFFVLFYKKIENVSIFNKEPIKIGNDEYKFDTTIHDNQLHIGVLVDNASPIIGKIRNQYFSFNIPLEPTNAKELNLVEDGDIFYKHVSHKYKTFFRQIKARKGTKEYEETERKLSALIQLIVSYLKREDIHSIIYKEKFKAEPTNKDATVWLHEFSYGLRNVLFHKVIDPFDKNWTMIAKYTSQALYDIVVLNIEKLKTM